MISCWIVPQTNCRARWPTAGPGDQFTFWFLVKTPLMHNISSNPINTFYTSNNTSIYFSKQHSPRIMYLWGQINIPKDCYSKRLLFRKVIFWYASTCMEVQFLFWRVIIKGFFSPNAHYSEVFTLAVSHSERSLSLRVIFPKGCYSRKPFKKNNHLSE